MLCARSLVLVLFLASGMAAHAQQTKTLRIGGQAVTLTSDKRSTPALAVQIPGDGVYYGFLTNGTAPGRLTIQMPDNQVYSLINPTNHTFSGIFADYPQVWTWDLAFRNTHPTYNGVSVDWGTGLDSGLSTALGGHPAIWPTYHVQAICSSTPDTHPNAKNPVWANDRHCYCRLKRRSDEANGGWISRSANPTAAGCAAFCAYACAFDAASQVHRRAMLLDAFANP